MRRLLETGGSSTRGPAPEIGAGKHWTYLKPEIHVWISCTTYAFWTYLTLMNWTCPNVGGNGFSIDSGSVVWTSTGIDFVGPSNTAAQEVFLPVLDRPSESTPCSGRMTSNHVEGRDNTDNFYVGP